MAPEGVITHKIQNKDIVRKGGFLLPDTVHNAISHLAYPRHSTQCQFFATQKHLEILLSEHPQRRDTP